jgi:hypothetical protein
MNNVGSVFRWRRELREDIEPCRFSMSAPGDMAPNFFVSAPCLLASIRATTGHYSMDYTGRYGAELLRVDTVHWLFR